ncbi:MAG: ABC transporter [Gammaproteobacteria bacterium]|nr:ABC transporter [Gammaproteobacteria bacterium]
MSLDILFDPLFRTPFFVGLILSALLPLLGNLLRLRDEWLAALGLAYLAGATGLIGLAFGIPAVLGAPLGALGGAAVKAFGRYHGNTVYALMVLVGWCTTMLVAANSPLGAVVGDELIEGQLYFAGTVHLAAAATVAALAGVALTLITHPLIRARLAPRFERANRLAAWRWHLSFDAIVALGLAVGAGTLGLLGAFGMAFVPPLIAFRLAPSWRRCQLISVGVGVITYVLAFACALVLDQPFGPTLVAVLVAATLVALILRRA